MDIQHRHSENNGSFFVENDNKTIAEIVYSLTNPAIMVIEHTEVDPSLKGKNIGLKLVNKAVFFAKENGMKIKAVCPFARSVFEKFPDKYNDILYLR